MPDEPDITDPELAPVQTTEPTLPRVAETVTQLEPVSPANTLDLEPVVPNTLDLEPEEVPTKKPLFDAPAKETSAPRRTALKRTVGGDGFAGASMPSVTPVMKTPEQRQKAIKLHQFGAWILLALISSGVLVVLTLLILLFR